MVIERMVSIQEALKNPYWMFALGSFISLVALFISFVVFPSSIGIFSTFLITLAVTPFMVNLFSYEEAKEEQFIARRKALGLLQTHKEVLVILSSFFVGMIFTYSLIFILLPPETTAKIFQDQIETINLIRGHFTFLDTFGQILTNNIGVLLLTFFFSFIFGVGAIFILAWNASVLSTAIGLLAKNFGGIQGLPLAMLVFFPHGSIEIMAYFIGGVSG